MNRAYVSLDDDKLELLEAPATRHDFDPRDARTVDLVDPNNRVDTYNIVRCERESGSDLIYVWVELSERRDTNPKDAIGISKAPMSVIPSPALHLLGLAMLEGSLKYGRHNFREAGIRYSVYYDALMRHMNAWWEGEDIDPDSGLPHVVKAMACCAILTDAIIAQNGNDDRPPPAPDGWMTEVNEKAKALLARYPNPAKPYTAK